MYITGPEVIKAVIGEEVTHDELGGAVRTLQKAASATLSRKAMPTASTK